MADLKYERVEFASHEALETAMESGDPALISKALYSATRYESDWNWTQNQCLRFLGSEHISVRWTAATCLGDLAMFKRLVDAPRVFAALNEAQKDPSIVDPASMSMSLVEQFALRKQ